MTDKRTVTVSVTINLGNYENLRLEVSDIAETQTEAQELRRFLSDMLDGFGQNDATAKHAIDTYKERILADSTSEEIESPVSYTFDLGYTEPESPVEMPCPVMEEETAEAEPVPVQKITPLLHVEPKTESAEYVCSKCGAPVNKLQHDVSMMFNNRILCKNCMK